MISVDSVIQLNVPNDDLKVAFASLEGDCVDQHFGSAQGFFVYQVNNKSAELLTQKLFKKEKQDGNEDKLKPKLSWLHGCDIVYCGSIGGSATRQLLSLGITPIQVKEGPDLEELLEDIQNQLNGEVSPQLQRIINAKAPKQDNRFSEMLDEGWDE